jgi:hypothetical protein
MLLSLKAGLHAAKIADRNGLDPRLSLALGSPCAPGCWKAELAEMA